MGGHGGLNILPEKSWHVYNKANKYKVAKDEEKAANAEEKIKQKNIIAEKEYRFNFLKQKANQQNEQSNNLSVHDSGEHASAPKAAARLKSIDQHINLFPEAEIKQRNQEAEADRRAAFVQRGGKKGEELFTSDAKFDQKFKFAYGLVDNVPWYARKDGAVAMRVQGKMADRVKRMHYQEASLGSQQQKTAQQQDLKPQDVSKFQFGSNAGGLDHSHGECKGKAHVAAQFQGVDMVQRTLTSRPHLEDHSAQSGDDQEHKRRKRHSKSTREDRGKRDVKRDKKRRDKRSKKRGKRQCEAVVQRHSADDISELIRSVEQAKKNALEGGHQKKLNNV